MHHSLWLLLVDVERLYIPRKDRGRGLIDEEAFKTVTIGLNHNLRHKEGQYPKQVLEIEGPDTHIKI